jgi:hypothetical protein
VPQDHTTYWAGEFRSSTVTALSYPNFGDVKCTTNSPPRGHIQLQRVDRRYGWYTGLYPPRAFGITTGHIGRSLRPYFCQVSTSPTLFVSCRAELEAKGKFSAKGKYPGNERLLWHGTVRACSLGEPGQNMFCTDLNCSLCSIARGSFNLANAKTSAFQRFGPGIYTSSKSSK